MPNLNFNLTGQLKTKGNPPKWVPKIFRHFFKWDKVYPAHISEALSVPFTSAVIPVGPFKVEFAYKDSVLQVLVDGFLIWSQAVPSGEKTYAIDRNFAPAQSIKGTLTVKVS